MNCLQCRGEIQNPKKGQRFCHRKCRYAFHNRLKKKDFARELMSLLKKYRVLDLEILDEKKVYDWLQK